jgi:hypothetical protein
MRSFFTRKHAGVRLFLPEEMRWTVFWPKNRSFPRLGAAGVTFVDRPEAADILVATQVDALMPHAGLDREFLVWTREPRLSTVRHPTFESPGFARPIHVMNCFTGDLNVTPVALLDEKAVEREPALRAFRGKRRRTAMLATHVIRRDLYVGARNIDLNALRVAIATLFNAKGACDVYGRGWPAPVRVSGESRGTGWVQAKRAILAAYQVNIALENTSWRYYITEKIWQAIAAGCLPVYYGADNGIYELFPPDSFVEAHGLSPDALLDRIEGMGGAERLERYALCVDAMNRAVARREDEDPDRGVVERTVARLAALKEGRAGRAGA